MNNENNAATVATWQPIETAPKGETRQYEGGSGRTLTSHTDGPQVLLFTPGRGVSLGFWNGSDDLWDRDWSSKKLARAEPPTHWAPLPAPPSV